jgi:uncharacterized protein YndB with AHSA1/START domain
MPDIFADFPIRAAPQREFDAVSTPRGLNAWWTRACNGEPESGSEFHLGFGPAYDWRAVVVACTPPEEFDLQITHADPDWSGTHVGFSLTAEGGVTTVQFYHTGWPTANEHWRVSCYCWPIYLRLLRRYVESGEIIPYEDRLNV